MNKKIKEALKMGELIDYDGLFASYPKRRQKQILKRARYLKASIALRKLRKQLKLSQAKLADRLNVKREFISRIESGRQNITLETLYKIAEATGKELQLRFT